MKEIWKDIPGYECLYQVSNLGSVRSLDRTVKKAGQPDAYLKGREIKQFTDHKGYRVVTLSKDCKLKQIKVHRLVLMAFIPNPDNLPQVNHKDGNKKNNCVENLEWCTNDYNSNHRMMMKRK